MVFIVDALPKQIRDLLDLPINLRWDIDRQSTHGIVRRVENGICALDDGHVDNVTLYLPAV